MKDTKVVEWKEKAGDEQGDALPTKNHFYDISTRPLLHHSPHCVQHSSRITKTQKKSRFTLTTFGNRQMSRYLLKNTNTVDPAHGTTGTQLS
jgi:hypothetical protein